MERLKNINQLQKGDKFYLIDGSEYLKWYEFLCIHPHNSAYILAIEEWTQNAPKLYINDLLSQPYYIGEFDSSFVKRERLKVLQKEVQELSEELLSE